MDTSHTAAREPAEGVKAGMVPASTPLGEYESEKRMRRIESQPLPRNLFALVAEAAAEAPDKVVLNFFEDERSYTYREFEEMVRAMADSLSRRGIAKGSHVALMTYTDVTYPVTWMALASLGAVLVPVNYAYTSRELEYGYTNSEADYLVIHSDFREVLTGTPEASIPRGRVIFIGSALPGEASWEALLEQGNPRFEPPAGIEADDLANIQYTSGTTGLPKGAMLSHRYWLIFARAGASQTGDQIGSMIIAQPFYYVDGEWMFLMMLFRRGTAYLPRRQSASRFLGWVKTYGVEFVSFPEIVSLQEEREDDSDNNLRLIYAYSHRLENYRRHEARYGCLARQGFAMTEIGYGMYVPLEADHMTGTGTVGIPSLFRDCMIADPHGNPVPDGELGEICVRGKGILQGYWGMPEATAKAFHPGGWFRTGDLGRRNAEGWFWYLGRMKDMVKRSGENVSATEVEAVLRGVPGVKEAAVLPVPDPLRGEEPQCVLEHCRANLARFKIPRYLEYVDEFPRTPSLKVKKSALVAAKPDLRIGSYDAEVGDWVFTEAGR
jgi:crotonobetaine/carnitine-CoA ligase